MAGIFALATLALLVTPALAEADLDPVQIESIGPSQADLYPGQSFYVVANLNRPLAGSEQVTIKQGGNVIGVCGQYWEPFCSAATSTDWSMNSGGAVLHFTAELSGGATGSASVDVPVNRFEFAVDLSHSPASVDPTETANIHAEITHGNMYGSPYQLRIRDDDSGQNVATCYNWWNTCDYSFTPSWSENSNPGAHHFSAYMSDASDADLDSNVATTTVPVRRFQYAVALDQSESPIAVPGQGNLNARVTGGRLGGTPNSLNIRDDDSGQVVASCNNYLDACGYAFATSWADNVNPHTRHYSAFVTAPDGTVISNTATAEFAIQRTEFTVVLDTGPTSIDIPGTGNLNARITSGRILGSPYTLNIRDDDTGQVVAACNNEWNACGYAFATTWGEFNNPHPRHFSAYVSSGDDPLASNVDHATFEVNARKLPVVLDKAPDTIDIPGTGYLNARLTSGSLLSLPFNLNIRNDDTGEVVASCHNEWNACGYQFDVGFGSNSENPPDRHYSAYLGAPDKSILVSNVDTATFPVRPKTYHVVMDASAESFSAPGTLNLYAHITEDHLPGSPYAIIIRDDEAVDDDNDGILTRCNNWTGDCSWSRDVSWDNLIDDGGASYSAYVGNNDGTFSNVSSVLVDFVRPKYSVDLTFGDHDPDDQVETVAASATASPGIVGTPFHLQIRNDDDDVVADCSGFPSTQCDATLGDGEYYAAVVTPSGKIIDRSDAWIVKGGEPFPSDINGVDLAELATAYATAADLCIDLQRTGGTHEMHGTPTDQYFICDAGAQAGLSVLDILKSIAAGAGAATLYELWDRYLHDHDALQPGWGDPGDEDQRGPNEPPPLPVPPPPAVATKTSSDMIDTYLENNPSLAGDRKRARRELDQCRRVAARAFVGEAACVEYAIFFVGAKQFPKATALERAALQWYPFWGFQHATFEGHAGGKEWYRKVRYVDCNDAARAKVPSNYGCHEWPMYKTQEGGEDSSPIPRLRLIPQDEENGPEGSAYRVFRDFTCHLREGQPFLWVPTTPRSSVVTGGVCN